MEISRPLSLCATLLYADVKELGCRNKGIKEFSTETCHFNFTLTLDFFFKRQKETFLKGELTFFLVLFIHFFLINFYARLLAKSSIEFGQTEN